MKDLRPCAAGEGPVWNIGVFPKVRVGVDIQCSMSRIQKGIVNSSQVSVSLYAFEPAYICMSREVQSGWWGMGTALQIL